MKEKGGGGGGTSAAAAAATSNIILQTNVAPAEGGAAGGHNKGSCGRLHSQAFKLKSASKVVDSSVMACAIMHVPASKKMVVARLI